MGNNSSNFQSGRERLNGSGLHVLHLTEHNNATTPKQSKKPMETKLLMWALTLLASSGYGLVILLNIDNVKGVILFIIACLYGIARLVFYCIKQHQEKVRRRLDNKMRELEVTEKERWLNYGDDEIFS